MTIFMQANYVHYTSQVFIWGLPVAKTDSIFLFLSFIQSTIPKFANVTILTNHSAFRLAVFTESGHWADLV